MSLRTALALLVLAGTLAAPATARAAVTVAAHYRLGDADPGAAAGNLGNDPTLDSTTHGLHLTRRGTPHYSSDVPYFLPRPDRLSMRFDNNPAYVGPGPVAEDGYFRMTPVSMPTANWGIEAWVKPAITHYTGSTGYSVIAYNGTYSPDPLKANGIGLFQKGPNYVVRIGTREKVLAPVVPGKWTHLAYLRYATANAFYVDGVEQVDYGMDAQAAPLVASGILAIGNFPNVFTIAGGSATDPFWGLIDEVRFFTYSPTGPTAFDASADLLYAVPEPGAAVAAAAVAMPFMGRRRRRPVTPA